MDREGEVPGVVRVGVGAARGTDPEDSRHGGVEPQPNGGEEPQLVAQCGSVGATEPEG